MKIVIIVAVLVLTSVAMVFAQDGWVDVVQLKNGSIIRGHITEQTSTSVKIKAGDLSEFVIAMDDVNKLVKERANSTAIVSANLEMGNQATPSPDLTKPNQIQPVVGGSADLALGIFYNRTIFSSADGLQRLGAGVGIETYAYGGLLSLYANGRMTFSPNGFRTHFYGQLGLTSEGPMVAAGIGGTVIHGEAIDLLVDAGFKWVDDSYRERMFLGFGLGVEF